MKNSSSLYILKPIFTILIGLILVLSCSQEETNPDMPAEVPDANAAEVVVNLLIKGEAILPPTTKQMSQETEGSYQDDLQLLILEKQQDNTYTYNCHRPVEGSQDNFTVKVPNSLNSKELKFLLFSNSKDIIGDPDQKFVVVDGTNKNEEEIRQALLLTVNTKWDSSKKIPMWAEDAFTFRVPTTGAPATPVATLKLMRMMARVDVGLNYNGKELNSTAQALSNFKLQKIKVHHSKDKGLLMPDANAYETTGTGADKVITIKSPSIPADGENIPPYEITVPDGSHASERDVYLFEQDMNLSQADFDVNRTCILVQGEYTATAPAGGTGTTYTGWYRLDFRDFGDTKGYADILRNKLYRFNITAVKGSGFATESDALNSVSSNITVELLAMDLNQNDIIFDGQSFLSVSGSELYFYRNLNTTDFSLTTNYANGWKIETGNGTGITATPAEGAMGSSVVKLTWENPPSTSTEEKIHLIAGNLKKTLHLKYVNENAPGDLTSFALSPPFLYFVKGGGVGNITITSNIIKKYLSPTLGNLSFTVPPETESESFNVTVAPFTGTSSQRVEQGVVNVHVRAANAEVTGQSIINQLTYDKDLECIPGALGHGLEATDSTTVSMDIPYTTTEAAGTYLIKFTYPDGGTSTPVWSAPTNGTGTVKVIATPNRSSKERTVGQLLFSPAEGGQEISLEGYTPKELTIKQSPAPSPVISIVPNGGTEFNWNTSTSHFTATVDNPKLMKNPNGNLSITYPTNGIGITGNTSVKPGAVDIKITPNRGDTPKTGTVNVRVDGHGDNVGTGQITFTQKAPDGPANEPSAGGAETLEWNSEGATLRLSNLSNIYEITARSEAMGNSTYLDPTIEGKFKISDDKTEATLSLVCTQNPGATERKAKITAIAIGNRESQKYTRGFIITQKAADKGSISFAETNKTVEHTASTGQVAIQSTGIQPGSINIIKTADWLTATLNADNTAVQYSVNANAAANDRIAVITLTAKDLGDRDLITSPALTITQKAFPEGSITLSTSSITLPAKKGTIIEVPYTQVNMKNGIRHELKYNVQQAGKDHFVAKVTDNLITCSVNNTNGYNFDLTAQLILTGYDLTGVERKATLSITHLRNQSGYFELPPFYEQPASGYSGTINLQTVVNMRAGEYTATTSAGAALPGWLTITSTTGHALNIQIAANTGKRRSQVVKVTGTDLEGGKVNQELDVIQAGASGGIQVTPAGHKFGTGRETKDFAVTLTNIDASKGIAIENQPDWIESANLLDNNSKLRVVKRQNPGGNTGAAQGSITLRGTDYNGTSRQTSVNVSRKGNLVGVDNKEDYHKDLMDANTIFTTVNVRSESANVNSVVIASISGTTDVIRNVNIDLMGDKRRAKVYYDIASNKQRYGEVWKELTLRWRNAENDLTETKFKIRQAGHPDPFGSFDIPRNNKILNRNQRVKFNNRVCQTANLQNGTKIKARIKSSQMGSATVWYQEIDANHFNKRFTLEVTAGSSSQWIGVVEIYGVGVDGREKTIYEVSFTEW